MRQRKESGVGGKSPDSTTVLHLLSQVKEGPVVKCALDKNSAVRMAELKAPCCIQLLEYPGDMRPPAHTAVSFLREGCHLISSPLALP